MRSKIPVILIVLLAFAGLFIWMTTRVGKVLRFSPDAWVEQYGNAATRLAESSFRGEDWRTNVIPSALQNKLVEASESHFSITIQGGQPNSYGMCYTGETTPPSGGLGGEPEIIKWEHVKGNWFHWVAD